MIKLLLSFLLFVVFIGNDSLTQPIQLKGNNYQRSIPFADEQDVVDSKQNDKRFQVNYELRNEDIFIECFVKDFTFKQDKVGSLKKDGEGHIHLYVNESKVESIFQPSFIIKALPIGTYKIKLQLVHNDFTPYGIDEEFEISIS
ncbi:hypothetical protein RJD24_14070 [Bacillaceae bacterium IKA-2]|nr:hypothetical protein RJD24_14070 [Bacillaceae bacterium IKA-2]